VLREDVGRERLADTVWSGEEDPTLQWNLSLSGIFRVEDRREEARLNLLLDVVREDETPGIGVPRVQEIRLEVLELTDLVRVGEVDPKGLALVD